MLTINNTIEGYLKNVEIKGNTVQNPTNLADIKSVGKKIDNQELYEIPLLSVGKNLFDGKLESGTIGTDTGLNVTNSSEIRSIGYIKIPVGKSIFISTTGSLNFGIRYYDKTLKYLGYEGVVSGGKLTVPSNAEYFRFKLITTDLTLKVQVETDSATQYEPYKSNKITILSPCQLEKVGDIADRIIEKNGVLGVEKNVETITDFSNLRAYLHQEVYTNTYRVECYLDGKIGSYLNDSTDIISNKLPSINNYNVDKVGIFIAMGKDKFYTRLSKNDITVTPTNEVCLKYLKDNLTMIKLKSAKPQFIPLPHDQQILLKTFDNKTNISFLTEIEGTIKAQVPKSIKATVNTHTSQIDNIYDELDRVKKLEESTVSTVTTDRDFANVQATTNGYFEDVKLSGKTLVNVANGIKSMSYQSLVAYAVPFVSINQELSKNKKFTLIGNVSGDGRIRVQLSETNQEFNINNVNKAVCFDSGINDVIKISYQAGATGGSYTFSDVMILEGDYTQNPPSYFEGLKSVGDGVDEIVVSSVNDNLLKFIDVENNTKCTFEDNTMSFIRNGGSTQGRVYFGKLNKGTYTISFNSIKIPNYANLKIEACDQIKDNKYSILKEWYMPSGFTKATFTLTDSKFIAISTDFSGDNIILSDVIANVGTTTKPYTPHKADKKRILYLDPTDNTWKKPILREWDTIEKHSDGKYYYHQRSIGEVHNGSENYNKTIANEGFTRFVIARPNIKINGLIVSDKFISTKADISREGVYIHPTQSEIDFVISNSKLETQDVAGFKKWLQTNNVTVVYQLAQEKVFECTNIDLITYQNETNYVFSGGVISPRTSLKVQNNISNVVSTIQKKVSLMENYVTSMFRAVLAGDMRAVAQTLYPNDFTHESVPMEEIK